MRTGAAPIVKKPWHLAGLLLVGSALAGCSGAHEPTQATAATVHAAVVPTTNVPALLGISIDGLQAKIGPPQPVSAVLTSPTSPLSTTRDSVNQDSLASFRTGGLTLIASYNAHTRQVRDLVLLGHHEDSLMACATLRANSSHYLVIPVFRSGRPGYLVGLRVVGLH